jgi:hypothetical protein
MKELILAQETLADVNRILKANDVGAAEAQALRDAWHGKEAPAPTPVVAPEPEFSSAPDPVLHEEEEEEIVTKVVSTVAPKFSGIKTK